MKTRYVARIAFDGGAYHGFQIQDNADTVQLRLENALRLIYSEPVRVAGCSRTDAGVHAREFYCSFDCEPKLAADRLCMALLANLPEDITVYNVKEISDGFHPRFDAVSKTYRYRFWNSRSRNPFIMRYCCHYPYALDERALDAAARRFEGIHDFAGFCSAGSSVGSTVRTVREARVTREGDLVVMSVTADGFLYNMVRIMAGTLLLVAKGELDANGVSRVLEAKSREAAGPTAPPSGLTLEKVEYRQPVF